MKYLYCEDCEEIFAEDNAKTVLRNEGYGLMEYAACPYCRSIEIRETPLCKVCGEPLMPDDPIGVCAECAEDLHKKWVAFVEEVMDKRLKANNGLSTDYLDCETTAIEYLEETGII